MITEYIPCTKRAYHYRARRAVEQAGRAWQCKECHKKRNLQVHHIDYDVTNNDPDNLELLCFACHKALHPERLNFAYMGVSA